MKKSAIISLSIFSIIALALISFGIYFIASAESSSNWIKTSAKVVSYNIVSTYSQRRIKSVYDIQIRYQYSVNNRTYTNQTISFGKGKTLKGGFNDRESAMQWLDASKFSMHKIIDVYVDPENPNKSLVYNGVNFITYIPLMIGLVFLVLIVFAVKSSHNIN